MSQPAPTGLGRWLPPVTRPRLRVVVRAAAISALGLATLRRLKTGDPAAPGWPGIARLVRPLDAINAGLDSPPTPHRRRAMLDVVALLLTRCAQPDAGSYWDWTAEQWEGMLGRTAAEFRAGTPGSVTRSVPIWRRTRSCWAGSPGFTGSAASNGGAPLSATRP